MFIQCRSRIKFSKGGHIMSIKGSSRGVWGHAPREIFKSGVPKIAFPAFWKQFPAIFNWLKSLIRYVTWTLLSLLNKFIHVSPVPVHVKDRVCTPGFPEKKITHRYFFRTYPGLRLIFQDCKIHINHFTPEISMLILGTVCHTFHIFVLGLNRFPELSRTSSLFPGFPSPGKCHNKIPGLSRFSRTRTNPVRIVIWFSLASAVIDI